MGIEYKKNRNEKTALSIRSIRFQIALLAFFGYLIQYTHKINMSISIVCMTNFTALHKLNHNGNLTSKIQYENCFLRKSIEDSHKKEGTFIWTKTEQSWILSAYFYGHLMTQVVSGLLAVKIGSKRIYLVAMLFSSIFTILTPFAARYSLFTLIGVRYGLGLMHGTMWPAMVVLWAHWAPPNERGRLIGFSNAGAQLGNVLALISSGYLCNHGFDGGWASMFHIFGSFGLIWSLFWLFIASDSPSTNRFISGEEKNYIEDNTRETLKRSNKKLTIPWRDIFTSKVCIGLIIGNFCSNFGTFLWLTSVPTYLNEILKFDITTNGIISAVPYIFFWLFIVLSSIISDNLIEKGIWSKNSVRKLFNCLGFVVPLVAVLGLCFITCREPYIGVSLLTIAISFTGASYGAGFLVNFNDIAGSYSGVVFGLSNSISTIPGIIVPYLVSYLTFEHKQEQWRTVFYITASLYLIGIVSLILTGSTKTEKWAQSQNKSFQNLTESIKLYSKIEEN